MKSQLQNQKCHTAFGKCHFRNQKSDIAKVLKSHDMLLLNRLVWKPQKCKYLVQLCRNPIQLCKCLMKRGSDTATLTNWHFARALPKCKIRLYIFVGQRPKVNFGYYNFAGRLPKDNARHTWFEDSWLEGLDSNLIYSKWTNTLGCNMKCEIRSR